MNDDCVCSACYRDECETRDANVNVVACSDQIKKDDLLTKKQITDLVEAIIENSCNDCKQYSIPLSQSDCHCDFVADTIVDATHNNKEELRACAIWEHYQDLHMKSLNLSNNNCPVCHAKDCMDGKEVVIADNKAFQDCSCTECGKSFQHEYTLTAVREYI